MLDSLDAVGPLERVPILVTSSVEPPELLWREFERHNARYLAKDNVGNKDILLQNLNQSHSP